MLKTLLLLFLGVFATALSSFAQTDWTQLFANSQATIQYKYTDCHRPADGLHKQEVYLKFTNLTNAPITISYQKQLEYNHKSNGQPSPENTFTVTLKPGEVLEGSCGLKDKRLYTFAKMLDGTSQSELTAFDLVNVKVTQN